MNQSRTKASRRAFLRAVGVGAASLPFFKVLENSAVNAEAAQAPLRFVGVYHPHGVAKELWRPGPGFDIRYDNCSLSPFDDAATYGKSFKDKLMVVEGVDLQAGIEGGTTGHDAPRVILTGSAKTGTNASIDQYLAVEKGLGAQTRFASLVLAVGDEDLSLGHAISFAKGGVPLPKIIDPSKLFDTVFAGLVLGNDPNAQAAATRNRKRGQSVIDFVRGDVQRLSSRLAAPEKEKLDQHLTSIRELEKRLEDFRTGGCALPTAPDKSKFPKLQRYNGGEPYFDVITDLQVDLLSHALACDLTRFATLFLADLSATGYDPSLPSDVHNEVAHQYTGSHDGHYGSPSPGNPATWLPLAKQNRYSYSKVARLMQRLDELGALDNTLIYASSDVGDPNAHSSRNVPTILAGGAAGKFKMGRHIALNTDCPPDRYHCTDPVYASNNKILVSICNAFGVPTDTFGESANPATITGALSQLA
jgi:hypothetical protein